MAKELSKAEALALIVRRLRRLEGLFFSGEGARDTGNLREMVYAAGVLDGLAEDIESGSYLDELNVERDANAGKTAQGSN